MRKKENRSSFWNFWSFVGQKRAKKTHSLFCVVLSNTLSLGCFEWSSLVQRINQISLHLLSRKSIALFHKGVFIYHNAVISVTLLFLSRHRRERERAESANTLSLKKRDRGLNPVDHKSTIKERACVCDHHRLAREYISLIREKAPRNSLSVISVFSLSRGVVATREWSRRRWITTTTTTLPPRSSETRGLFLVIIILTKKKLHHYRCSNWRRPTGWRWRWKCRRIHLSMLERNNNTNNKNKNNCY